MSLEQSRVIWIAVASFGVLVSVYMLRIVLLDYWAVAGYPDTRGKRIVAIMHIKTELLLLLVQVAFLAVAFSAALDVGDPWQRSLALGVGSLMVGLSAVCRYADRRRFDEWHERREANTNA